MPPASAPFIVVLAAQSLGTPVSDRTLAETQGREAVERIVTELGIRGPWTTVSAGLFGGTRWTPAVTDGTPPTARASVAAQSAPGAAPVSGESPVSSAGTPPALVPLIVGTFVLRVPTEVAPEGVAGVVHLLVEGSTCYLRGAVVRALVPGPWQSEWRATGQPLRLPTSPLAIKRSPVRFVVRVPEGGSESRADKRAVEMSVDRARVLHEAVAGLESEGLPFPVRSEIMAPACAHFFGRTASADAQRLRIHRDVAVRYVSEAAAESALESVNGTAEASLGNPQASSALVQGQGTVGVFPERAPLCGLQTAPFGSPMALPVGSPLPAASPGTPPTGARGPETRPTPWSLRGCLDFARTHADAFTEPLDAPEFEIVSRQGRWVTFSAGRTAGLAIGSRLVSANGAKLHVIRIVPPGSPGAESSRRGDQAIAYVRSENSADPLRKGSRVRLDPLVVAPPPGASSSSSPAPPVAPSN